MNPPQVYMCSPSWTLLSSPSPYHPSGSSQCTSPKHPSASVRSILFLSIIVPIFTWNVPLFSGSVESQFLWPHRLQPTPVLLPGKSHGWRSLEGCSPWGRWGSDTTEQLHFQFSLSCIGEGNGNPLQCSCLENPRDGGAWWAAIYGVAQSRTRLKWLSTRLQHARLSCPSWIPGAC